MARRSAVIRGILILALGFNAQVNAQCSRSIEAHDGDTCASLAALTGITVAQFLKSNPAVTSCSTLTPGRTYCVEGTAPAATSSATSPVQTSGPLQVSTDGTCGPGVTCKGSRFGGCCSEHGFCGSTADYCGDGCQPSLGTCGSDPGTPSSSTITPPPAGTATKTVTVTSTATTTSTAIVSITRASIVLQTSTVVVTSAVISTSTRTALVTATGTVTATVTSTAVITSTATASAKAVTLTSIVFSTSTQYQTAVTTSTAVATRTAVVTSTAKVTSTSVVVETLTTIKTVSITACGGGGLVTTIWQTQTNRPTPTIIIGTTRIPGGPSQPRPTPYLPGSSNRCRNYDQIQEGDTCRQIANRNSVSLLDFYKLNPSIDCDDLWPGYFVCVEEN
ncbi:carbohydrate-binding module family 18 protein [Rhypophila decipiens]